jgi:hypothetical protein
MSRDDSDQDLLADMGRELHALSCTCKAICTWNTQKACQECREACGGHGYLYGKKYKRLFIRKNFFFNSNWLW